MISVFPAAVMALVVGFTSLVAEELWVVLPGSPYFSSPVALCITASCVLFGGCIAFLMVWAEFSVIQETSALTFMVAGTFKEIVTGTDSHMSNCHRSNCPNCVLFCEDCL